MVVSPGDDDLARPCPQVEGRVIELETDLLEMTWPPVRIAMSAAAPCGGAEAGGLAGDRHEMPRICHDERGQTSPRRLQRMIRRLLVGWNQPATIGKQVLMLEISSGWRWM